MVILGSNVEGGVMEWKGAREWAIERNSIRNKKEYTERWGYELEIVNMLAKKRYSHEWRESWEKVDIVRETMRKYPNAEWWVLSPPHPPKFPMSLCANQLQVLVDRPQYMDNGTIPFSPKATLQSLRFHHLPRYQLLQPPKDRQSINRILP